MIQAAFVDMQNMFDMLHVDVIWTFISTMSLKNLF